MFIIEQLKNTENYKEENTTISNTTIQRETLLEDISYIFFLWFPPLGSFCIESFLFWVVFLPKLYSEHCLIFHETTEYCYMTWFLTGCIFHHVDRSQFLDHPLIIGYLGINYIAVNTF